MMRIVPIDCKNAHSNLNYLIVNEVTKGCICIDPYDALRIKTVADEGTYKIEKIINTHEHWDHIKGNPELKKMTGCEVWNAGGIENTDRIIRAGESINFGSWKISFPFTPGHTMKHISLLVEEEGKPIGIFCGDTLFNAGVGNCHNGGHPEVLYETFSNFFSSLPDSVMVYPGHDYVKNNIAFAQTREPDNPDHEKILNKVKNANDMGEICFLDMGEERQINPFLRLAQKTIQENLPTPSQDPKEVFLQLRQLRNEW